MDPVRYYCTALALALPPLISIGLIGRKRKQAARKQYAKLAEQLRERGLRTAERPAALDAWRAQGTLEDTQVVIEPVDVTLKGQGMTLNGPRTCVTVTSATPPGRWRGSFALCKIDMAPVFRTSAMVEREATSSTMSRLRVFADDSATPSTVLTPTVTAAILDLGDSLLEIYVGPDCVRLLGPEAITDAAWVLRAVEIAVALRRDRDPKPATRPPSPGSHFGVDLWASHVGAVILALLFAVALYAVESTVQLPVISDPVRPLACGPNEHLGTRSQRTRRGTGMSLACFPSEEDPTNTQAHEIFFVPFFYLFDLAYFPTLGIFLLRRRRAMGRSLA